MYHPTTEQRGVWFEIGRDADTFPAVGTYAIDDGPVTAYGIDAGSKSGFVVFPGDPKGQSVALGVRVAAVNHTTNNSALKDHEFSSYWTPYGPGPPKTTADHALIYRYASEEKSLFLTTGKGLADLVVNLTDGSIIDISVANTSFGWNGTAMTGGPSFVAECTAAAQTK